MDDVIDTKENNREMGREEMSRDKKIEKDERGDINKNYIRVFSLNLSAVPFYRYLVKDASMDDAHSCVITYSNHFITDTIFLSKILLFKHS